MLLHTALLVIHLGTLQQSSVPNQGKHAAAVVAVHCLATDAQGLGVYPIRCAATIRGGFKRTPKLSCLEPYRNVS